MSQVDNISRIIGTRSVNFLFMKNKHMTVHLSQEVPWRSFQLFQIQLKAKQLVKRGCQVH